MSSSIKNVFTEKRHFEIPPSKKLRPHLADRTEYERLYQESIENPDSFWSKQAEAFCWFQKWNQVLEFEWGEQVKVSWFAGAKTNLSVNCLDRHLETQKDKTAIVWEGNEPGEVRKLSYGKLHREVCRLANALKHLGVKKGDRVAIYMSMVPELAMSLLACARIGAVHNVIFGGFSAKALHERIQDCQADFVITADGLLRGAKTVALKPNVDLALEYCGKEGHNIKACLVLQRTKMQHLLYSTHSLTCFDARG